jgi:peptide/nickel transport system substrate-binding protein
MHGLLPPGLLGTGAMTPARKAKPAAATASGSRAFTLGYEAALPEHRAVAERLQVLLHDAGFKVKLRADSRAGLARARAAGEVEAALVSVLLPPVPAPALAVVLGLTGDASLLGKELPSLGAVADADARAKLVGERAQALQPSLPVLPLFARGLRLQLSPSLIDARRDAFGLLVLDDAWLAH